MSPLEAPLRTKLLILARMAEQLHPEERNASPVRRRGSIAAPSCMASGRTRWSLRAAAELADALRVRGAKVSTRYFPQASHDLGQRVEPDLRHFCDNLLDTNRAAAS